MVILVILLVIVLVWSPEHVVGWSSRSILVFPVSHPNDHVMEEGCWTLDLPRPYSLAITVQLLRRTPNNLVNRWEAGRYIRGIRTPQGNCLVTVRQCGSIEASAAEVTIAARDLSESVHAAVIAILRRVLALDVELAELSARFDGEPGLQSIAQHLRGMRPPRFPDLFETIASVVPFQQLSLESGAALLNRLVQAFGESVEHDGLQAWVFPSARSVAAATVADVRGCGFSTAKAQTLTHVARLIRSGALTESHLAVLPTAGAHDRAGESTRNWPLDVRGDRSAWVRATGRISARRRGNSPLSGPGVWPGKALIPRRGTRIGGATRSGARPAVLLRAGLASSPTRPDRRDHALSTLLARVRMLAATTGA